ncbi:unnamed protein product [Diamesa serratosioi]
MYCDSSFRLSGEFCDNSSRLSFVRRVFMLLVMALLVILGQADAISEVKSFLGQNYWIAFIATSIFISTCLLLSCSAVARTCFPWNFILLVVLVECIACILCTVVSLYKPIITVLTLSCLAGILLILITFTLVFPVDFTTWTAIVLLIMVIAFVYAITALVLKYFTDIPDEPILWSLLAVAIISILMLVNLQIIFSGTVFEMCADDSVLGAILMLADVIVLFMCCLKLVGFNTDAF